MRNAVLLLLAGLPLLVPAPVVASDVDPVGEVTPGGSGTGGGGDCDINLNSVFSCLNVTTVSMDTIRFANFGFNCKADASLNPCTLTLIGNWSTKPGFPFPTEALNGFPTGITTLNMNFNARVSGASPGGMTSGTAKFCIVNGSCLQVAPFQLTGNGQISAQPVSLSFNLASGYDVTAEIDLTLPAGATLFFDDLSLQFVQGTTLGAVQVCKVAGPGVTPGTNYSFKVQGPDFHVSLAAPAGAAPGGCSFVLSLFTGTSIVVTETPVSGTTVGGISGGSSNNLAAGSAGLVIGAIATTLTFSNKGFGTQGC